MSSYVGTPAYMAPELLQKKRYYQGRDVDLFAVAVVLFVMYSKTPPFTSQASHRDPLYKLIVQHKMDKFWEAHEATKPEGFYSKEFKELLSCMFQ